MFEKNAKLISLIISIIVSFVVISKNFNARQQFENLGLGEDTSLYFAKQNNVPIHIDSLYRFPQVIKGWEDRGKKEVLLFFGNSQTHAINQIKKGETNYIKMFSDTLSKQNKDVLCISMPNASLQETMLSFDYAINNINTTKYVFIPVFMDDLREDIIRADIYFRPLCLEHYQIQDSAMNVVKKVNIELRTNSTSTKSMEVTTISQTLQDKVETYFDNVLNNHSAVWQSRDQIRGEFFTYLYMARNNIFNINAQTKRKMIRQRYIDNLEALDYMLKTCENKKIKALVYIPPIRDDVEVPYILSEYINFKIEVENNTKKYSNAQFSNLESIVPGKFWGVKGATHIGGAPELDFMHFQYEGHKILFSNLYEQLKLMMAK